MTDPKKLRPKRNPTAGFSTFGEEATVVLPDGGHIKVLNEVGTRIWELMDGQRTVDQIVDAICEEFDTDREQAEGDVHEFLDALARNDMLG